MKKVTYDEFCRTMWEYGETHNNNEDYRDALVGVIVYKASNWPEKEFTELERSYRVSSCNRCFQSGKIANSMFGDCLDGKDLGVRLDWYNWEVDYCYFIDAYTRVGNKIVKLVPMPGSDMDQENGRERGRRQSLNK